MRRVLGFTIDWFVIAGWAGVLFGGVMIVTGGQPPRLSGPWTAQGLGLLMMTLPVTLYFAVCESSAMQASLGKRALGLIVVQESGERLSFGLALRRNAVKFIPWECGHVVAQQAAFSAHAGLPLWVWIPALVSLAGTLWWFAAIIATGRTPYDRWASARVALPRDDKASQAQ